MRFTAAVIGLMFVASPSPTAEPWADPKLPVTDGLELWLDATKVSGNASAPSQGAPIDQWRDASGHGRHVLQPNAKARPTFVATGSSPLIHFDGETQHLRFAGPNLDLPAFTIIIVGSPRANLGGFHGMLAFNAAGRRDYESGINIDFGPDSSAEFDFLNIEGRGFPGVRNLLNKPRPYGPLYTTEVHSPADGRSIRTFVDGAAVGQRPRMPGPISMAEVTVGGRYFTNGPGKQQARCFFVGDLAEVLVYSRELNPNEPIAVRKYLDTKYAALKETLKPLTRGKMLERIKDPPAAQMLVPGFSVREIPIDLPNINNIRYRPDGKLLALCYNGDAYLLSDTDGDGLPDKAELFWDNKGRLIAPIGMDLTPPGYKHGDGFFVASKGKCSLVVDTNSDGKADKEIVIAQGWPGAFHTVDALGVAFDRRDGSVYFGIGCANFLDAYLRDKEGKGHYSLKDERGTIMHVSQDFSSREIVCTGIRFPVGLAFNRLGDLFATDQEGATWLPNGNPLDELLHIQKGRHYGFPPRHPKHLPDVIDEPSVFDYGPQHQSTCGLWLNESVNGGPVFGPVAWTGNAIIAGESRGKLYRTELVKTPAGYVARNHIIACLDMLTIGVCGSPDGGLIVACHSGKPDWGTGPNGRGKLFKITYSDPTWPQPLEAWAAGPREVRVRFNKELDPQQWRNATERISLSAGKYVRAGDRFESLRPGYQAVQNQLAAPRYDLAIRSVQLSADGRELILATDRHAEALHYALTLPRPTAATKKGEIAQSPQMDLDYDLSGVEARWRGADGETWTGRLPHLDLDVARGLSHDRGWDSSAAGELHLQAQLDLHDMLRPAVQPGSQIDYTWPAEEVTLVFTTNELMSIRISGKDIKGNGKKARFTVRPAKDQLIPIEIQLKKQVGSLDFSVSYHTNEDPRPRALQLHRILLPWASIRPNAYETAIAPQVPPELASGSWARGRRIFFDESIGCAKCHSVQGRGGASGPDLSNLIFRDYDSVLRDIAEPNAAINPDYVTYAAHVNDGRVLTGTVRSEGDQFFIGDQQGKETRVAKSDVELLKPQATSIMPEGLPKLLGAERLRDVMTFLLTEPRMPVYAKLAPPPPRQRAEVLAALAGAPPMPKQWKPLNIVLVAGQKDHGVGEHDYPAWQKVWKELIGSADNTTVTTAWEWPSAEEFRTADAMVFFQHGNWTPERAKDIDAFLLRGCGLTYLHWAVDGQADAPGFAKRIGLAGKGAVAYRHGPLDLDFRSAGQHPITRNISMLRLVDESYWQMVGDLSRARLLATSVEDKQPQPQCWALEHDRGRVFVSIPGHYSWTFDDPLFRLLILRGIAWSAHESVDRFNELVWPGARVGR